MELIRPETAEDVAAIRHVHEAAFPTAAEAALVERLRASSKAVIALVAEDEGRIVGHILFSPVALDPLAGTVGLGLAPVAVLPDHEKHGVGRRLVQTASRNAGPGAPASSSYSAIRPITAASVSSRPASTN